MRWRARQNPSPFMGAIRSGTSLWRAGRCILAWGALQSRFTGITTCGSPRSPTKADMVNCTRLGERLQNVDFVLSLCSAGDVPKDEIFLHEYDALMRNTTKPVVYSAPGRFFAEKFIEMACAASGGEAAFRQQTLDFCFCHSGGSPARDAHG